VRQCELTAELQVAVAELAPGPPAARRSDGLAVALHLRRRTYERGACQGRESRRDQVLAKTADSWAAGGGTAPTTCHTSSPAE